MFTIFLLIITFFREISNSLHSLGSLQKQNINMGRVAAIFLVVCLIAAFLHEGWVAFHINMLRCGDAITQK